MMAQHVSFFFLELDTALPYTYAERSHIKNIRQREDKLLL